MQISPRRMGLGLVLAAGLAASGTAASSVLYSNGFETDTTDWSAGATRVASGFNGIPSADGSFHAEAAAGAFTRWGGYNFGAGNAVATAFQEYWTTLDIYLDVGASLANDTRFDFTSAINNAAGTHLRDFAFNVGFYDDATGPGAGTDRFVISASNNTGRGDSDPKNVARAPIAIDATGWYTFQHHFYDNAGVLAVDLGIFDDGGALLNEWTLSDAGDLIAGVGGNRYGWFPNNELDFVAIDNAQLRLASAVPAPASALLLGVGLLLLGSLRGALRSRAA